MLLMFPWLPQRRWCFASRGLRSGEAALTAEGTLVLVIATSLVLLCGWLAWQYSASTDDEARAYADQTIQRLLFAHDAKYFAANLSPTTSRGYPHSQQRVIITSLTKLGVPVAPVKVVGAVSYSSNPGAQDPQARFSSRVTYSRAEAHVYLDIARRHGLWQIDQFALDWQDKSGPGSSPSP